MAELCKHCFIQIWQSSQRDIDHIVMSSDETVCESCLIWGPYVDHIKGDDDIGTERTERDLRQEAIRKALNLKPGDYLYEDPGNFED